MGAPHKELQTYFFSRCQFCARGYPASDSLLLLAVLCTAVVRRVSSVLFRPFFSRSARRRSLECASSSPFYLLFYVHYPECYSGTHVYTILCQSPDFALKNPIYFLKIVAKIIRKVIFCQNETLICEYRTSFS